VIEVKREGKIVETITSTDLAKLDENSRKLIKALEDSMQKSYDIWVKVYPDRDDSTDKIHQAKTNIQLTEIAKEMCRDLSKIFQYLNSIGKHLEDHYSHVQFVCKEIEST
jgi:hypothetical protein